MSHIIFYAFTAYILCIYSALIPNCFSEQNDDAVVYEINGIKIKNFEVDKYFNKHKTNNSENIDSLAIINNFENDLYFLADAYDKELDKNPDVINVTKNMEVTLLTQVGGYVYNEYVTRKINVSESDIQIAYDKRNKFLDMDVLKFNSYDDYKKVLDKCCLDSIRTQDDFYKVLNIKNNYDLFEFRNYYACWPFVNYWEIRNYFFYLPANSVSSVAKSSKGIFVFFVKKTELKKQKPLDDNERNKIKSSLSEIEKQLHELEYYKIIDDQANIFFCNDNLSQFMDRAITINDFSTIDKKAFFNLIELELMRYSYKGEVYSVTVSEFIDYYNDMLIKNNLYRLDDLKLSLKEIPYEKYLYDMAKELGFTNDSFLIMRMETFLHKEMIMKYVEKYFHSDIEINDQKLNTYYNKNILKFSGPNKIITTVIFFDNPGNAINSTPLINNLSDDQISKIKVRGMLSYCPNSVITYSDTIKYPRSAIQQLYSLRENEISSPFFCDGKTLLFIKRKDFGSYPKPFEFVRETLIRNILKEETNIQKLRNIRDLKQKYKLIKYEKE